MKHLTRRVWAMAAALLLCAAVLCGCDTANSETQELDQDLLEFPGTTWTMKAGEVQQALSLSNDCWTVGEAGVNTSGDSYLSYVATGLKFLDQDVVAEFCFTGTQYSDDNGLSYVCIYFTDTDCYDRVLSDLTAQMGEPEVTSDGTRWYGTEYLTDLMEQVAQGDTELSQEFAERVESLKTSDPTAGLTWEERSQLPSAHMTLISKAEDSFYVPLEGYDDCPLLILNCDGFLMKMILRYSL